MARKISVLMVAFCLLFTVSAGAEKVISIGTATPGGSWYAIGGTVADIITKKVKDVTALSEVTGGAVVNVKLLGTQKVQMGITINAIANAGYKGKRPFKEAYTNLRTLLAGFEKGNLQIVTLKGSGIEYVDQLKGKRVAVGPKGHGSLIRLKEIFGTMGFGFDDITPVYLPLTQAMTVLGDKRVDASVMYMAPPTPAIKQFELTHDIALLKLKEAHRRMILDKYAHYVPEVIPKGSYEDVDIDIATVATPNVIIVDAGLDDDLVYSIVKAIFDNLDTFRAAHPSVKRFNVETAPRGGLAPYHPGAIKYYKEKGVWNQ